MTLTGVSKTALMTLRGRADEHRRGGVLKDPMAVEWLSKMSWPEELNDWYQQPRVAEFVGIRAHEFDLFTEEAIAQGATSVVELGCGMSTRRMRMGASVDWLDVDLPQVIEQRATLGVDGGIACSVLDDEWMAAVPDGGRPFFLAEGLLYYLPRSDVDALFVRMRRRFPGALIAFDVLGEMDFEMAQQRSARLGTPILWKVDSFSRAFQDFGVVATDPWDPRAMMDRALTLYWSRFGKMRLLAFKAMARIDALANKRSGVVAGALQPHQ